MIIPSPDPPLSIDRLPSDRYTAFLQTRMPEDEQNRILEIRRLFRHPRNGIIYASRLIGKLVGDLDVVLGRAGRIEMLRWMFGREINSSKDLSPCEQLNMLIWSGLFKDETGGEWKYDKHFQADRSLLYRMFLCQEQLF